MGLRKPANYVLNENEIQQLKDDIHLIGADESIFSFNSEYVRGTCYRPQEDRIHVKGNVLSDYHSTHPRDLMSQRAVLAHEYYGHRPYRAQYLLEYEQLDLGNDELLLVLARREWADEFRASYMAAKYAPGLTQEDRYYLILDALERAREAFISIKYNDFIRRALHGTNQHE